MIWRYTDMTEQFERQYTVNAETKNDAIASAVLGIFLADADVPGIVEVSELNDTEEWEE